MPEINRELMPDIFHYVTFHSYFKSVYDYFKSSRFGPKTNGEWAQRLGYKSPRSFGMILSAERLPSEELLFSFSKYLNLNKKRRDYLYQLVKLEKQKKNNKNINETLESLSKLNSLQSSFSFISHDEFEEIASWYYFVLRQILKKPIHESKLHQLVKQFNSKVSLNEIEKAINVLLEKKYLIKNIHGYISSTNTSLNTKSDIPSHAIIRHHSEMIDQAKIHLRKDNVQEREFQSLTLRCSHEKLQEAKAFIREFKEDFNKQFADDQEGSIYQLNIQFFKHVSDD